MKKTNKFLDLDFDYKKSKVVILPVPYEGTVSYMRGASKGPDAIIEASLNLELYDIEIEGNISDIGIATLAPVKVDLDSEKTNQEVYKSVKEVVVDNKLPVVLGGEHSITSGSVKAVSENFNNLSVLQIDAHTDLRDVYEGDKYSHACVMKRIVDMGLKTVQVGIRSQCDEEADLIKKNKLSVFFAKDIYDNTNWMPNAVSELNDHVYVTIDIDGFDPSVAPTTGTPEPGGLGWYNVLEFLRVVAREKNIVGFDVVEVIPDKNKVTDFTAAKLVYKLIGYIMFKNKL